jgi:hypothetical protein
MFGQSGLSSGLGVAGSLDKSSSILQSESREPEMVRVLGRQSSLLSELEGICHQLEQRLNSVTRSSLPTPPDVTSSKPSVLPGMLQVVDSNSDRINQVNMFVSDLLSRLEI